MMSSLRWPLKPICFPQMPDPPTYPPHFSSTLLHISPKKTFPPWRKLVWPYLSLLSICPMHLDLLKPIVSATFSPIWIKNILPGKGFNPQCSKTLFPSRFFFSTTQKLFFGKGYFPFKPSNNLIQWVLVKKRRVCKWFWFMSIEKANLHSLHRCRLSAQSLDQVWTLV